MIWEIIKSWFQFKEEKWVPPPIPTIPEKPKPIEVPTVKSNREILYDKAKELLSPSRDVSPLDIANDEVGCVESLWNVINKAFPNKVGFPLVLSTIKLKYYLDNSPLYEKVTSYLPGDIILNVTGTGNGNVSNGHTGITGKFGIMSNDSRTGLWLQNYTYKRWDDNYRIKGGMKTHYFRRK